MYPKIVLALIFLSGCGSSNDGAQTGNSNLAVTSTPSLTCSLFRPSITSYGTAGKLPYGIASGNYAGKLSLLVGSNDTVTNSGTFLVTSADAGFSVPPSSVQLPGASSEVKSTAYNNVDYWFMSLSNSVVYFPMPQPLSNSTPMVPTLTTIPTGSLPRGIVIHDLNGDQKPDLIVANRGADYLSVVSDVFATPTPSAIQVTTGGKGPGHVQLISLDSGSGPGLAVLNYGDKSLSLCVNNSTPTSLSLSFSCNATQLPTSITVPDRILVGKFGIAISDLGGTTVSFFTVSKGNVPTLSQQVTVGRRPADLIAWDKSIVVANLLDDTVSVLQSTNGTFSQTDVCGTGGKAPRGIVSGDFNQDGKLDIAVANQNSDTISILLHQ